MLSDQTETDEHTMRTGIIAIALLLTASLLAWKFWPEKPADRINAKSSIQKSASPNTPSVDLFKAIAPLTYPEAPTASTSLPQPDPVLEASSNQAAAFAIKQRDNASQSGLRFEKIAFDGARLTPGASRWSCALDTEAGLLWETKLANGGVSDMEHTYSWFKPALPLAIQGKQNGGNCYSAACDTHAYTEEMNRIALCGSKHWRLPEFSELERLIDRQYYNPTINQKIFPYTKGTVYWTNTELTNNPDMVMQIDFFNGVSNAVPKKLSYPVRVVSNLPTH